MLPNEGVHETLHLPSGSKDATEQKACRSVTTLPLSKFDLRSHSESPDIESLKVWDPRDLAQMSTKPVRHVTHLLSELDSLPAPAGQASKKFHQRRPPAMQPQGNRQGNRIESQCIPDPTRTTPRVYQNQEPEKNSLEYKSDSERLSKASADSHSTAVPGRQAMQKMSWPLEKM